MIFGALNPEKIWHQYLVHLPTIPVYCSHFTLGIQKSHFQQYYPYILQIICVISEENKLLLPYPPRLKNVTTLPCKMHKFFIVFIFTHFNYQVQSEIRTSCGSILLRHGLKFSRAWWTMQLISCEKDWKHVSLQKVVTLNTCCNVACLAFNLPHTTTSSFQSHQRLEECSIPSVRWKSWAFYKVVWWHFSGVVDKGVTVCFLLR